MALIYYNLPDLHTATAKTTVINTDSKKTQMYYFNFQEEEIELPAVSHNPKFTMLPSTETLALKLSNTVGM